MPSAERVVDRAVRRADRIRKLLGEEIRNARLGAGTSQAAVARVARLSQPQVSRIEAGALSRLSIRDAVVLAEAVGLDISVKAYPGGRATRDAAHARKLTMFLGHVGRPLRYATEVPLPRRADVPEQRAWDALIFGAAADPGDTGVELEMRLYDVQAQTRRIFLKWRDSGTQRLLLLIHDTQANRRTLRTYPDYFAAVPRLRTASVIASLERGERPPTGLALV